MSGPPEYGWKVVPLSRTSGRETPVTEFVMCSRHEQLPHVIGVGPQRATTHGSLVLGWVTVFGRVHYLGM